MLKANTRDGRTLTFDLGTPEGKSAWRVFQASPGSQQQLSGLSILHQGMLHTLPTPKHFKALSYTAELVESKGVGVAEKISCQADDVKLTMTVYFSTAMTRMDLQRVGKPRHLAPGQPWPQDTREG